MALSMNAQASYTVKGPATPVYPLPLAADGVLHAKTRLHLATTSTVNSKTSYVGDKIGIVLDRDVKIGDEVVIPKGTPVDATITNADHSRIAGTPGDLAFEVHSLTAHGVTVPLKGGETLLGANHTKRAIVSTAALMVTFVGMIPALMMHGGEAQITPGMNLKTAVAK